MKKKTKAFQIAISVLRARDGRENLVVEVSKAFSMYSVSLKYKR